MKATKFQPGTFLEVDDLAGGRKVVSGGRDGATYWDVLDANRVTPLVIHPSQNPQGLGSMADFVHAKGLQERVKGVVDHLRGEGLDPESDPLFVMRVLWEVANNASGQDYGQAVLAAKAQETAALKIHARAAQYHGQQ